MSSVPVTLVIDANATPKVGAGHVMRCANLAGRWVAAGYGTAVCAGEIAFDWLRARLAVAGVRVDATFAAPDAPAVLVVDDYDPAARERGARRDGFLPRVLVDDIGGPVNAGYDVVWNPSAHANPQLYPQFAGTVLAGPEMLAVREDLPDWSPHAPDRVAVLLGAGALSRPLRDGLVALAAGSPQWRFAGAGAWVPEGWDHLDPSDPWAGASHAELVVIGAGITVWEAAVVGAPAVLVQVSANQAANCRWAGSVGCPVVDAGAFEDPERVAAALTLAMREARPLPRLSSGVERVAAFLYAAALGRQ